MRSPLSIKPEIEQDLDPCGFHRFDAWVLRTSAHSLGLWNSGYPWLCQTDAGAVFRIEVIIIARHGLFLVCLAFLRFMIFQFFNMSMGTKIVSLFILGGLVFLCGYLYRYALRRAEERHA